MGVIGKIKSKLGIEAKAGIGYMFGNILVNGIAFLTMPIFTRMLSTADYGTIGIYSTYVNIFLVIVGLNLNAAIVRAYIDFKDDFKQFLSANLFLSLVSFCAIFIIVFLFRESITRVSDLSYLLWVMILLQSFSTFVINYNSSRCIVLYKYKQQITISIINTVVGIALSILFIYFMKSDKYIGKIVGTAVPMVFIAIVLLAILLVKGKSLINKKYWKYALFLSLPLVPHLLAHLILAQSDRLLIDHYIGKSATGIYNFAYNVGLIVQILILSINNAWVPWFFKKMQAKDHSSILSNSKTLSVIIIFLSLGLMLISPELVRLLGPEEYREGTVLIPIIIVSYIFQFMYTLLVNVQFYEKKNYYVPIGTTIAAGLNIVLNIIFIPRYGYQAAAVTTLVSYIVLFILHYIVNTAIIKNKVFKMKFFIKYIVVSLAAMGIFYLVMDIILIRYAIIILIIAGMLFAYKDKITGFLNSGDAAAQKEEE